VALTISNADVQTFERNVRWLAQQEISRFRPYVREVADVGITHNWDLLSQGSATQKTGTLQPTPNNQGGSWTRRSDTAQTWNIGDSVEQEQLHLMLIDPLSSIAYSMAMAMKRAIDDLILAAATGLAVDGQGNTYAFPAGQTIGTGVEIFSFDMVTNVNQIFQLNNIDPMVTKCFGVDPIIMRKMLQLTEATSGDYVNVKELSNRGFVNSWMGFNWVVSTRLLSQVPGTNISLIAFTERAIGLHVAKDFWTRVAEDPSTSFVWRLFAEWVMGAMRVEDQQIVQCFIADST
jgi:Phage capsid protein